MNPLACLALGITLMTSLPAHRSFSSPTISVDLSQEEGNYTLVTATEHGNADYLIVEVFYWTDLAGKIEGKKFLLHKEVTTPLAKNQTMAVDIPLPLTDIAFIRVKEMKLVTSTEFGRKDLKP